MLKWFVAAPGEPDGAGGTSPATVNLKLTYPESLVPLECKGVAIKDADDWTIEDSIFYGAAQLSSNSLDYSNPVWKHVPKNLNVHYAEEFHFDPMSSRAPTLPSAPSTAAASGVDPGLAAAAAPPASG